MKKLYRRGDVHQLPPLISDQLAFLPGTILTHTASLTPQDREVLAYLLSCSANPDGSSPGHSKAAHKSSGRGGRRGPSPLLHCSCFGCYTSYWVRWDSSPNRQLIHEIIDFFEERLVRSGNPRSRRDRRKRGSVSEPESDGVTRSALRSGRGKSESAEEATTAGGEDGVEGVDTGSVRKFVSLIGERIWNVWGQ